MNNRPELYNAGGGVRQDFSDAELAEIPADIKPRFDALRNAATAAQVGEQAIRDATLAVRAAKADVTKKQKRLAEIKPVPTFMDLHRAMTGKPVQPVAPEILDKVAHIESAIVEAQGVLAQAQDNLVTANRAIRPLRIAQGDAFANYQAEFPAKTFSEVHRQAALNYRKPREQRRQFLSEVDAIAAGTKQAPHRRHPNAPGGFGFRRGASAQRGIMPSMRPKLPSEV